MKLEKSDLQGRLEAFIFKTLAEKKYDLLSMPASKLLTWNRFDLAFKLFYLDNYQKIPQLSKKVYTQDIKSQTLGRFQEFGNDNKTSIDDYLAEFEKIYNDLKINGYDDKKSVIPLSCSGTILNGAHRVASSISLDQNVSCIFTDGNMKVDYNYFYERGVPLSFLNMGVRKFIEYCPDDVYIAFLWPSGEGHKDEAFENFSKVVFSRDLNLTRVGAFNLLYELYKHMDWVGSEKNGYDGIQRKLVECFPKFEPVKVVVFQADSLNEVLEIKKNIRNLYNIGYSSIHITDTKQEALDVSTLLFNENSLHFLNHANFLKNPNVLKQLDDFKLFLEKLNINAQDVVLDGSIILAIYGLRQNDDVDFLLSDHYKKDVLASGYEIHDSELKYHEKEKNSLIYDPRLYFEFYGLKFISFKQVFKMKQRRGEKKDIIDCKIMNAKLENKKITQFIETLKQKLLYSKIRLSRNVILLIMRVSKGTKFYTFFKTIYRFYKR